MLILSEDMSDQHLSNCLVSEGLYKENVLNGNVPVSDQDKKTTSVRVIIIVFWLVC